MSTIIADNRHSVRAATAVRQALAAEVKDIRDDARRYLTEMPDRQKQNVPLLVSTYRHDVIFNAYVGKLSDLTQREVDMLYNTQASERRALEHIRLYRKFMSNTDIIPIVPQDFDLILMLFDPIDNGGFLALSFMADATCDDIGGCTDAQHKALLHQFGADKPAIHPW